MTEWPGLALLAGLLAAGCPDNGDKACEGGVMAFRVLLVASDGPLPADTALVVGHHGTSTTEYRLGQPPPGGNVLFCWPATRDGERSELLDGGASEALVCELWTDGTARVTVNASDYPTLDQQLDAKLEGRCLVTRELTLTLDRGDAGS